MNNRLYTLLKKTNFFQFSFRKKYSTKHALIYLTELIKKQMDDGNYGCGIFFDFHNALSGSQHTSRHEIRGISNKWFASYHINRNQFVSITGFNSALADTICGGIQGSILGLLLFLVYINDLHCAIEYCKVHHVPDDTNLMNFQSSIKTINKLTNHDLRN